MKRNRMFITTMLALMLAGSALAAPNDADMAPSGKQNQELYWQGHESLKQGRWDQAVERFQKLEARLRKDEPAAADAAIYWQAYAQSKGNRTGESRASVERLRREFPQSRWLAEADRLVKSASSAEQQGDLVEAALDGLMSAPPERAIPLLKKVLEGNYPDQTKQRALFVLSQLDADEASAMVMQIARSGDGKLRREAIQMLGISGGKGSIAALESLAESGDVETRRAVLEAFMIAGHVDGLAKFARGSDPAQAELRVHAVQLLGAAGGVDQLEQLLAQSKDAEVSRTILDSLGVAGAVGALATFAESQADAGLREQAIRAIGIAGGGDELARLYAKLDTPPLRQAALEGLMIAGDAEALTRLYREARDDAERRAVLRMLTITGGDSAIDAIEEAIKQGERR
ncbi:MAG: HEAT repeat domain-containing protein [Xanthomonadales bacterium]|nr:HEAT repeat domain-containing protein [Xanthomonadales bacterium]